MFSPPVSKEKYYYHAAKRFMMDAQLLRCRAAIHVEDKDDIVFWSNIFKHFRPNDRFHFIAGSRNERGHETRGVTQCLKYVKYLNPKFFICIDSDYRYLLQEQGIDVKHYIFQTYTYSFENHHCYDKGLNELCYRITTLPNNVSMATSTGHPPERTPRVKQIERTDRTKTCPTPEELPQSEPFHTGRKIPKDGADPGHHVSFYPGA